MRFNLKVSKNGFIYLIAPIFASNITTFVINRKYWSLELALFTFIVYFLLMFAFIKTSGFSIYQEKIYFKVFGITFQALPFNEIECIKLTENGIGHFYLCYQSQHRKENLYGKHKRGQKQ